jgi:hypothetical protein
MIQPTPQRKVLPVRHPIQAIQDSSAATPKRAAFVPFHVINHGVLELE